MEEIDTRFLWKITKWAYQVRVEHDFTDAQEKKDKEKSMRAIERYDVNENWAHSGIVKAGDYCFLNYCH